MPHYLIFHVGGNDVDVVGCSDELIDTTVLRLVIFLNTMKIRYGIRSVVALQITPRTVTRRVFCNDYIKRFRQWITKNGTPTFQRNYILENSRCDEFCLLIDGVHFNGEGFIHYYWGVRGAIIQSMGIWMDSIHFLYIYIRCKKYIVNYAYFTNFI